MSTSSSTTNNNTSAQKPTMDTRSLTRSSTDSTTSSSAPISPSEKSMNSPRTEQNFFGVIREKIRDRSRSRSRNRVERSRSRSPPTVLSNTKSNSPTRPKGLRHSSNSSQSSNGSAQTPLCQKRASTGSSGQFSYYGRHGNEWLFNNFSVTDSLKDAYHHFRPRRDS